MKLKDFVLFPDMSGDGTQGFAQIQFLSNPSKSNDTSRKQRNEIFMHFDYSRIVFADKLPEIPEIYFTRFGNVCILTKVGDEKGI
jgi:hypothetical protein